MLANIVANKEVLKQEVKTYDSAINEDPSAILILPISSIAPIQGVQQKLVAPIIRTSGYTRNDAWSSMICAFRAGIPFQRDLVNDLGIRQGKVLPRGFALNDRERPIWRRAEVFETVLNDIDVRTRSWCVSDAGSCAAESGAA